MSVVKFQSLGSSGLKVSPLILGCMSYGNKGWASWVLEDEEEVFKILKKAYDAGLRTYDTANMYSNGVSEILLGKFLKKYDIPRDRVVILSKVYFAVDPNPAGPLGYGSSAPHIDVANSQGLSRKHIFDAVEASVKRLGTYLDVLQIHRLDHTTPKTEIMRTLNDVVTQGHSRYIGASSMKAYEFVQLQNIAEKHNWVKFISMQNYYNLLYREEEREMIPYCNDPESKVGIIPWSPIAGGLLARPFEAKSEFSGRVPRAQVADSDKAIIERVEELAKKHEISMAVIATSWAIQKGTIPIVGINSEARVDDILKALSFNLSEEEIAYLEEKYQPKAAHI